MTSSKSQTAAAPKLAKTPRRVDVIEPPRRWPGLDLAELWDCRELLHILVIRELRLRYAQTWIGAAWVLLKPVLTMLLLWAVFGLAAGLPTEGVPLALFFFSGLVPWFYFSGAVADSQESLVGNADLIRKVYFPRLLLPLATVLARLIDLGIMCAFLVLLSVVYAFGQVPNIAAAVMMLVLTALLATAIGVFAAAVNVRYRDAQHIAPVLLQLLMFASPIVYSVSLVPERWRTLYWLNPFAGPVAGFRAAVLGHDLPLDGIMISTLLTAALLAGAVIVFLKMEPGFADHV